MRLIWFLDTSVVCNVLPVPGMDQDRETILAEMRRKLQDRDAFILPVTAVIETGNHIAQLSDGRVRRQTALRFADLLGMVMRGEAPWQLHAFSWDDGFIDELITGARTGRALADLAMEGVGCGDLCVLAEREVYRQRAGLDNVRIWTLDGGLHALS